MPRLHLKNYQQAQYEVANIRIKTAAKFAKFAKFLLISAQNEWDLRLCMGYNRKSILP